MKNVKNAALISTAILGIGAVLPVVASANNDQNAQGTDTSKTNATVSFDKTANNSDPVGPVDSSGSALNSDNTSGITNETGSLTVDRVPVNLNFGHHNIDANGKDVENPTDYTADYLGDPASNGKESGSKNGSTMDPATDGDQAWGKDNVWLMFTKRQADATDTNSHGTVPATPGELDQTNYTVSAELSRFNAKAGSSAGDAQLDAGTTMNFAPAKTAYASGSTNGSTITWGDQSISQVANTKLVADGKTVTPMFTSNAKTAGGDTTTFPGMGSHYAVWGVKDITLDVPNKQQLQSADYAATINWTIAYDVA